MDHVIDTRIIRRRRLLKASYTLAVLLVVISLCIKLPGWIKPSVKRDRITSATVLRGHMESTVSASGNVIPSREHIVSCPINTRLTRIVKVAGDIVVEGDVILELDTSETTLNLTRLGERIALKNNECVQSELDYEEELNDLGNRVEIQKLELESLRLIEARTRQHFEIGGIPQTELDVAVVNVKRALLQLDNLETQIGNSSRGAGIRKEKLELELRILEQEHEEARHRLDLATTRVKRGGVVTWVPSHEGVALNQGQEIARIADLSNFKVEARLSDAQAEHVWVGQTARVQIGQDFLVGNVANIYPAVESGVIRLIVNLESGDHPQLRPNLRVEVHLVKDERLSTLMIKRGIHVRVDGRPAVFVIRDEAAVRTPIELGLTNFDYLEVLSGLAEGDEVILTDMNDYVHLQEVKLR
ncbi:MAG: HlyD family efflux transporter periplasmic adaptor subunit [bacterium]|nr:HlyD family efflux transporter periplasmic adaptor subunit [bacterium]